MKNLIFLLLLCIAVFCPTFAHPGSLDANGGHYNRKTGEYHYHEGLHTEGSSSRSSNSPRTSYPSSDYISIDSHEETLQIYEDKITELKKQLSEKTSDFSAKESELTVKNSELIEVKRKQKNLTIIIISLIVVIIMFSCIIKYISHKKKQQINELIDNHEKKIKELTDINNEQNAEQLRESHELASLFAYEKSILKFQNVVIKRLYLMTKIEELKRITRPIPDGYDIDIEGLPKEKDTADWGKTFTIYTSPQGHLIHVRPDCIKSAVKTNIYTVVQNLSSNQSAPLCKKCGQHYIIPSTEWVSNNYKLRQRIENYEQFRNTQFNSAAKDLQDEYERVNVVHKIKNTHLSGTLEQTRKKLHSLNSEYNKLKKYFSEDT